VKKLKSGSSQIKVKNALEYQENPFLGRFSLCFSAVWLEQLVLVEEFLLLLREDKLEHGTDFFFNHSKNTLKKAASKPQGSFFCSLVRFLNSNVNKGCIPLG